MEQKLILLNERVWVPSETKFTFQEQIDPHTGEQRYILQGLMLPFNKISRNNVLYNKESIIEKHKQLIGRPLMYNHKVNEHLLPIGHFIDSWIEEDGWYYKADIDPMERDIIRKLKRQDLRHVSIQLIGEKVVERQTEDGRVYTEAWVSDIIEGSLVPAPGFLDTTAQFAEAIGLMKEDVSTGTAPGSMTTKLMKKEGLSDFPEWNEFVKGLLKELEDNNDLDFISAAKKVLANLEISKTFYSDAEKKAEEYIMNLGEKTIKEMLEKIIFK